MNVEGLKQLCTFRVDRFLFGLDVDAVQEVQPAQPIAPVPLGPAHITGLISLRGHITAVLNFRARLHLPEQQDDAGTTHLILRLDSELICLPVDELQDVVDIDPTRMQQTPNSVNPSIRDVIEGVYQLTNGVALWLDPHRLLATETASQPDGQPSANDHPQLPLESPDV